MDKPDNAGQNHIFKKQEILGSGAFGDVFKATIRETGVNVAIKKFKILKNDFGISPEVLKEVVLLRGLEHDNIIK